MPLHDLHLHYATLIDQAIAHLLPAFHELPANDAILALQILSEQEMLDENAGTYLPLPKALSKKRFHKIKETLQTLHRIMQNPNPEKEAKYSPNQGNELYFGVFGLEKRPTREQAITSQLVRHYLIHQFQLKIGVLKLWEPFALPYLAVWKKNDPSRYQCALAQWIKNEAKGMPDTLKKMIHFGGILQIKMQKLIKEETPSMTEENRKLLAEAVVNQLTEFTPALFDSDTKILERVLLINPMDSTHPSSELQRAALSKMQQHLQDKHIHEIIPVSQSFIAAEQAYRLICHYKKVFLKEVTLHDSAETHCEAYLKHITEATPQMVKAMDQDKLTVVNLFLTRMNSYLKDNPVDFIENCFRRFFAGNRMEQDELFSEVMKLHAQNKLYLKDDVIHKMIRVMEEPNLDPHPYNVNRIMLHACLIPIKQWTPLFVAAFNNVLLFLQNKKEETINARDKRYAYPAQFINQLIWLSNVFYSVNNTRTEEQPVTWFPLLYYPKTVYDFNRLLVLYTALSESWSDIIKTLSVFFKIMEHLSHIRFNSIRSTVAAAICTDLELKKRWPDLIASLDDYQRCIVFFGDYQHKSIFNAIQWKLHTLIKKAGDYIYARTLLANSTQEQSKLFHDLTDKWGDIILTADDFCQLLPHFKLKQFSVVCHALQDRWEKIITSPADFIKIINAIQTHFPSMLEEKKAVIFRVIKKILPKIIRSCEAIKEMMVHLTFRQCIDMLEGLKNEMGSIIHTYTDLLDIVNHFKYYQKKPLPLVIIEQVSHIPLSIESLALIFNAGREEHKTFYRYLKTRIPTCINSLDDLFLIQPFLKTKEFIEVVESVIDKLPDMIHHIEDLVKIVQHAKPNQGVAICLALKNQTVGLLTKKKIVHMINTYQDLLTLLGSSGKEKNILLCNAFKDILPDILIDFFRVLDRLFYTLERTDPEVMVILKEIRPEIVKKIAKNVNRWSGDQAQLTMISHEEKRHVEPPRAPMKIEPVPIQEMDVKSFPTRPKKCSELFLLQLHSLFSKAIPGMKQNTPESHSKTLHRLKVGR